MRRLRHRAIAALAVVALAVFWAIAAPAQTLAGAAFRPLIADSAVLSAVNTRMVTPRDFIATGTAVALKPEGRKAFFRAYEQRMDTLVTHPLFGYRVNYRRILEIQTRLLALLGRRAST